MTDLSSNAISMFRGNNKTVQITVLKESTGLAFDLTGCSITMYIKKDINDVDNDAVLTKVGTIVNPITAIVEFYLLPNDTENITQLGDETPYYADFKVVTGSGSKYTVLRTLFVLLKK